MLPACCAVSHRLRRLANPCMWQDSSLRLSGQTTPCHPKRIAISHAAMKRCKVGRACHGPLGLCLMYVSHSTSATVLVPQSHGRTPLCGHQQHISTCVDERRGLDMSLPYVQVSAHQCLSTACSLLRKRSVSIMIGANQGCPSASYWLLQGNLQVTRTVFPRRPRVNHGAIMWALAAT